MTESRFSVIIFKKSADNRIQCFTDIGVKMKEKIEDRVALHEERYRALADQSVDSVWVLDAETLEFIYISPSTHEIRGYTREETVGKNAGDIIVPDSYQTTVEVLEQARQDYRKGVKKSYKFEVGLFHKDGSTVWVEVTAKFVEEKGEPLKIVGISKNITERKSIEKEREELVERLEEALADKVWLMEEIKMLESILPICSGCRRIRHDDDTWWPLEKYIEEHSESKFSYSICPDCSDIYYKDM